MILKGILTIILLLIFYQDIKYRAVTWYLFPWLALSLVSVSQRFELQNSLINAGFVLSVFIILSIWFSLKDGKIVNLFERHIGLGDLLFLISISAYFSIPAFFFFYLLSLVLIVIGHIIYTISKRSKPETIPLAGLQSLFLLSYLIVCWTSSIEISITELIENII